MQGFNLHQISIQIVNSITLTIQRRKIQVTRYGSRAHTRTDGSKWRVFFLNSSRNSLCRILCIKALLWLLCQTFKLNHPGFYVSHIFMIPVHSNPSEGYDSRFWRFCRSSSAAERRRRVPRYPWRPHSPSPLGHSHCGADTRREMIYSRL